MYGTGDIARRGHDGILEFLGRSDRQVKLRGFRIELGEIEARLKEHPAIRSAVAIVHREGPGAIIVAYIVPRDNVHSVSLVELRSFLAKLLPQYMVPGTFVFIDEIPLTPNGKVDAGKLPSPEEVDESQSEVPTPLEQEIAKIWCSVLGLEKVGIHENFFVLGGHSLLASHVILRIEEMFGITVPVRTMFEAPTIAELSNALGQMAGELGDTSSGPAAAAPIEH